VHWSLVGLVNILDFSTTLFSVKALDSNQKGNYPNPETVSLTCILTSLQANLVLSRQSLQFLYPDP
jgi:hypothetical protein